jgi:hypothetical protein
LANLRPLYAMRAEAARGVAVRDFFTISCEFASSSSRALADPRSCPLQPCAFSRRRAPIWRAGPRSARSTRWCLRYSPWPRRQCMLYSPEERLCKRKSPWRSTHAAPRLCAPLPAAPSARASELSNLAGRLVRCAQPAAQSPGDGRTCVSSYGASSAGHVRKKRQKNKCEAAGEKAAKKGPK